MPVYKQPHSLCALADEHLLGICRAPAGKHASIVGCECTRRAIRCTQLFCLATALTAVQQTACACASHGSTTTWLMNWPTRILQGTYAHQHARGSSSDRATVQAKVSMT